MDIKTISGGANPYVQSRVGKTEGSDASAKAKATSQTTAGDRVSVSSDAKLVAEAAKAAEAAPDVRTDKVEALRAQVQAGTYTPNSQLIAQKMVQSEVDFQS
jgi:negative regulator of flagellin synthesis FlgM